MELGVQLLDQLNHRLKNNLQMLYGLLQTAYRKTQNTEARNVLSDTSRRIGPMGAAQQVFYSVRNSTDVCMRNARAFFSEQVSINYEAAAGLLPKETPLPLALALNELLTNAAKHGADDRGEVTINVGLSQGSGEIELCVRVACQPPGLFLFYPHYVRSPAGSSQIRLHPNSPRSSGPPGRGCDRFRMPRLLLRCRER